MKKFAKHAKFLSVTLVLLIISASFISCGSASKSDDNFFRNDTLYTDVSGGKGYGYDIISPSYEGDYDYDNESAEKTSDSSPLENRKIITTVNISAETKEFDDACKQIETRVANLGGYIQSSNSYGRSYYDGSRSSRSANYPLRIPADKLNEFTDATRNTVNIISQRENVDDITDTYVDVEARLNSLKLEEERLLVLLEKGDNLSDIITVEERLSDVRYQIDFAVDAVDSVPTILVLIVIAAVIVLIVLIIKKNCKKKKEKRIAEFMARQNKNTQK